MSDRQPTAAELDAARREGEASVRDPATALALENAILREAAGKTHDPDLVYAALSDRTDDLTDDDGHVDSDAVHRAVRDLLHRKPILKIDNAPDDPDQPTSDFDAAFEAAAARHGLRPNRTPGNGDDPDDDGPVDHEAAFERAARAQGLRRGGR